MPQESAVQLLKDPLAQELLHSKILARVAYTGLDGFPRVVPIWFHWNNKQFVMATAANSPKVKALSKFPNVAMTIDENTFPPKALLVRGTATVELVDGLVPEHIEAARKYLGIDHEFKVPLPVLSRVSDAQESLRLQFLTHRCEEGHAAQE